MKRFVAVLAMFAVSLVGVAPVFAELVPVPTDQRPHVLPVIITAYSPRADGLAFVQIYNTSSELVQLDGMNLNYVTAETVPRSGILTQLGGFLKPKTHVLVSVDSATLPGGMVSYAEFLFAPVGAPVKNISITSNGFLPATTPKDLKYAASDHGKIFARTYNTDSYSTAATALDNELVGSLYFDRLYEMPGAPQLKIVEIYPYASDCAPNDISVFCGDYVKLHNPTNATVNLGDIVLRTDSSSASSTTSNTFYLGQDVPAGGYLTVWLNDNGDRISLTNSGGYIWLDDVWDVDSQPYSETMTRYGSAGSSQQGHAWAEDETGTWRWTSAPQPNAPNVFPAEVAAATTTADLASCPAGKYRNPETNRCRTIEEAVSELAACEEGKERNPATNRCRSIASTASTVLAPCEEDEERNPATNRCRKAQSGTTLTPCQTGYERNPATNRCRKIVGSSPVATPAAAVQSSGSSMLTTALLVTAGIGAAGYGVYEWRSEIGRAGRRAWAFILRK